MTAMSCDLYHQEPGLTTQSNSEQDSNQSTGMQTWSEIEGGKDRGGDKQNVKQTNHVGNFFRADQNLWLKRNPIPSWTLP